MTVRAGAATLQLVLDRTSPVPLYHQLVEQFTAAIANGVLKPGDGIEREDVLAERLDISRPTLRRALGELAERGLLLRTRGVGTIVSPAATAEVRSPGGGRRRGAPRRAWIQVLRLEPDHVDPGAAVELGLDAGSRLVYLEQLVVVEGRVVGFRRTWLPAGIVDPLRRDLTATPVRRALKEAGHPVASERRTFGVRSADPAEQGVLGLRRRDHVFTVSGLAYDSIGVPIERTTGSYCRETDQYDTLLAAG
jgi:DNA-binding GntR family transcriptional regulator